MPTTPTSIVNRLMGAEAFTDALNFGGVAQTFAAGTTIGGSFVGANVPVAVAAATTTLTVTAALHAGKIVTIASTGGLTITPPAATGTGNLYQFAVITTISGGNLVIDAKAGNASDLFAGNDVGIGGTNAPAFVTASNSNLMTFNATTSGGIAGTWIEMLDAALHTWIVFVSNARSGNAVTVFSNH